MSSSLFFQQTSSLRIWLWSPDQNQLPGPNRPVPPPGRPHPRPVSPHPRPVSPHRDHTVPPVPPVPLAPPVPPVPLAAPVPPVPG